MSVTILPMSKQFGWRDSVMGAVSSSFNWGYMFTNLFGGYLAGGCLNMLQQDGVVVLQVLPLAPAGYTMVHSSTATCTCTNVLVDL